MKSLYKILLIGLLLLVVMTLLPVGRAAAEKIASYPQNAESAGISPASTARSTPMELSKAPWWVKGMVLLVLVLSTPLAAANLLGEDKRGSLDIR